MDGARARRARARRGRSSAARAARLRQRRARRAELGARRPRAAASRGCPRGARALAAGAPAAAPAAARRGCPLPPVDTPPHEFLAHGGGRGPGGGAAQLDRADPDEGGLCWSGSPATRRGVGGWVEWRSGASGARHSWRSSPSSPSCSRTARRPGSRSPARSRMAAGESPSRRAPEMRRGCWSTCGSASRSSSRSSMQQRAHALARAWRCWCALVIQQRSGRRRGERASARRGALGARKDLDARGAHPHVGRRCSPATSWRGIGTRRSSCSMAITARAVACCAPRPRGIAGPLVAGFYAIGLLLIRQVHEVGRKTPVLPGMALVACFASSCRPAGIALIRDRGPAGRLEATRRARPRRSGGPAVSLPRRGCSIVLAGAARAPR